MDTFVFGAIAICVGIICSIIINATETETVILIFLVFNGLLISDIKRTIKNM